MSICRVISYIVGKECFAVVIVFTWQNSVSFCPVSFCVPRQMCLLLQVSLDFLLFNSSPLWWKGCLFFFFFLVLVLESLIGLQRMGKLQLLWHQWLGMDLDYCDIGWFTLEMNWDPSVISELHPSAAVDSFVDSEGYSSSSKEYLPSVVDIMIIWVKFSYSCPFLVPWFPKMFMFTLAISWLIISNLPWFMDLTFQVHMQYCSS